MTRFSAYVGMFLYESIIHYTLKSGVVLL